MTGIFKRLWSSGKSRAFDQAMELYNARRYSEAVRMFEAILAEKKSSSDIYYNLAAVYCSQSNHHLGFREFLQGNYTRACDFFEKAIELQPGQLDLYLFIGICRNNMRDYDEAADAFQLLLSLDQNRTSVRIMQGIVLHNLGSWERSVNHHRAILRDYPDYPDIHYRQGLALTALDRLHEARESFRRALALNPAYRGALLESALIEAHFGRHDEADRLIARVVPRNPADASVLYARGSILLEREDWEGAAAVFSEILTLAPGDINAMINLALIHVHRDDLEGAVEIFDKLKGIMPQDRRFDKAGIALRAARRSPAEHPRPLDVLRPWFRSVTLLDNMKREISRHVDIAPDFEDIVKLIFSLPESDCHLCRPFLEYVEEYIAKNPEYPDLYYSLGLIYIRLQQDAEGEKALRAALLLNPNYHKARRSLFSFLKERGRHGAALLEGDILLRQTKPGPDLYVDLAEACLGSNEPDRAHQYAEAALKLKRNHARAWLADAQALERLGRREEAAAAVRACLGADPDPAVKTAALTLREKLGEK
ncbi:MAG: tetratricopeptide repeat protein [Pseudomonadota bacterium]|nr:tetratricopeptide repeat protein [Pseudomonadota bacterium]